MGLNFTRLAQVADRLIGENGRTVTLVKLDRDAEASSSPWRGPDPATPVEELTVTAVLVDAADFGFVSTDLGNTIDRSSRKIALVAALDVPNTNLEEFDLMRDGDDVWKIVTVRELQPGTTTVLYQIELEGRP